jgi:hypothetical protein
MSFEFVNMMADFLKDNLREKQGCHFWIVIKFELMDFPLKNIWNVYFYNGIPPIVALKITTQSIMISFGTRVCIYKSYLTYSYEILSRRHSEDKLAILIEWKI